MFAKICPFLALFLAYEVNAACYYYTNAWWLDSISYGSKTESSDYSYYTVVLSD